MNKVKVDVANLLRILNENKTKHIKEYELACKNYPTKVKEVINAYCHESINNAEKGKAMTYPTLLPLPESHEEDYNTSIKMLEFSTEKEVEITNQEFQQFVQDRWSWAKTFAATASFYNSVKQ